MGTPPLIANEWSHWSGCSIAVRPESALGVSTTAATGKRIEIGMPAASRIARERAECALFGALTRLYRSCFWAAGAKPSSAARSRVASLHGQSCAHRNVSARSCSCATAASVAEASQGMSSLEDFFTA